MSRYRNLMQTAAIVLSCAVSATVLAADEPAKPAAPPAPGLSDVLASSGITESGYIAASYYHSNGYSTFHQFDTKHDSFQLDQAGLTLSYQPKTGFGGVVQLGAGEDMRIVHGAEDGNDNTFEILQGYISYVGGPVTVIAGKFLTLAGAEVIAPTGNTNFSRSLLFFAEPLTHTGVRATFAASDTLSFSVGANNGWNTTSTSYGSKTAELGVGFTPNKKFALTAQAYIGKEPAFDAQRTLVDLVATFTVTDALNFVLSYDWGKQEQTAGAPNLNWSGVAAYGNYQINDQWRLSVRAEYLNDKDGFVSGTTQKLKEGTLTFGYDPAKSFELRLEARYDKSDQSTFVRSINGNAAPFADSQTGVALQGVYKF
jgi:Putative beta-barrel porin-2, OmpL-like. bbp2